MHIILLAALLTPAAALAQTALPKSRINESEPFQLRPGSTFSASAPASTKTVNTNAKAAERARITADIRAAAALIASRYVDARSSGAANTTPPAIREMLRTLDPHSNFYTAGQWRELLDEQDSGYAGIGTAIAEYRSNGEAGTYIICTFEGTPARNAGLRYGDRVVSVNGRSVRSQPIEVVRDQMRGASGTVVKLTVERGTSGRLETVTLKRGIVPQPSIPDSYMVRPSVGYIDLSEGFTYTTVSEFDAAIKRLHSQGLTSLVIDLRGNGGGIVDQAVKLVEKFVPRGTRILSQRGRTRADDLEWRSANPTPERMPLVVLVDENTASASEIVAGAMQDLDRAIIVGEKTFGKGLVQSVLDLPYGTGLTLTAARYYTPSGRSIQRDYTHIGRYEYFSHLPVAAAIDRPYFEARTLTNRKVTGGDGIIPDEIAARTALTSTQRALIDPLFFFARERLGGAAMTTGPIQVDDRTVDEMIDFATRLGIATLTHDRLQMERHFIRTRLEYEFTLAASGEEMARRTLAKEDPQLLRAIESIPQAARLYAAANSVK